jgi:hypothetical protein
MANITRFIPLDDVPDADARGAGIFLFDDGTQQVTEDPELAELVKSYQDELPRMEKAANDQRLASNDPIGAVFGADPFGQTNPEQAQDFVASLDADRQATRAEFAERGSHAAPGLPPIQSEAAPAPATGLDIPAPASAPAEPSDAQNAAELHRLAGQQALQGRRIAPQAAGYSPQSRTGALPTDVANRQMDERDAAIESVIGATEQQAANEAEDLRRTGLHEQMRLTVQREEQERIQREAAAKQSRLQADRRRINDAEIDTEFAKGKPLARALGVLGAALLGAIGSDAGLRMIENAIDRNVRNQMSVRGSKLQALAEELGSVDEVISAAKAKAYEIAEKQIGVQQKFLDAAGIEHKAATIRPIMRQRALDENQAQERANLGKTTEVYQQGHAGGMTGPDLEGAAKHYEAAAKLNPEGMATLTADLDAKEKTDFIARVEGLADGEHALNEMDQLIGIQRDAAGNVANRDQIGDVEGAGFFGGRVPDEHTSQRGAALSREQRRFVQAQVKAMSGAAATDVERAEYSKNIPLTDEKDLLNSTTEERRRWHKNYAKAVSLYGQEKVDGFMNQYRGQRGRINAGRGMGGGVQPARGQVIEIDEEDE